MSSTDSPDADWAELIRYRTVSITTGEPAFRP